LHKAGRVAAGGDVKPAVRPRGGHADKRGALDELAREVVEAVGDLRQHRLGGRADDLAQSALVADGAGRRH
jgi:hypothetical protein